MALRVDTYHESYRLSLYTPFWVLNRTDLKLEFQVEKFYFCVFDFEFLQIENNRSVIDVTETPYLICPEKFESEASKKVETIKQKLNESFFFHQGQIRVYGHEQNDATASWSEKFSLDVIKSTGMTSCKVANDRTYMVKRIFRNFYLQKNL